MMKPDLSKAYSSKQIEVLKACRASDWFMLINHGAKRSGKTQVDNDLFLQELIRVRGIANKLGIDTPQYILAGYSLGIYRTISLRSCRINMVLNSGSTSIITLPCLALKWYRPVMAPSVDWGGSVV